MKKTTDNTSMKALLMLKCDVTNLCSTQHALTTACQKHAQKAHKQCHGRMQRQTSAVGMYIFSRQKPNQSSGMETVENNNIEYLHCYTEKRHTILCKYMHAITLWREPCTQWCQHFKRTSLHSGSLLAFSKWCSLDTAGKSSYPSLESRSIHLFLSLLKLA